MVPEKTGIEGELMDSRDKEGALVRCSNVTKHYGAFAALKNVTLNIFKGEVVCVVGPSGSGKSTLLRAINGLQTIDHGTITFDGITIPGPPRNVRLIRREAGMVFQSFNLFPHMTIRKNVTLAPIRARGLSEAEANERAERLLKRVGIGDQIDKYPDQLSGGQQQRVAIARALAMEPKAMLFDEPTSALDPEMVKEVLEVIRELATTGMTMMVVTHEMGFARELSSRMVFMIEGSIIVDAAPPEFFGLTTDARLQMFLSKVL
jgi:ABC-type polar amino acid transport system ATPase subunit